jgi:hypothetical protein
MRAFTLILMAATVFGVAAHAQQEPKRILVRPGITKIVPFDQPVGTVSVGNPAVADAFVVTAPNRRARVLVVGKISGETSFVALDDNGNVLYDAIVTVEAGSRPAPPVGHVAVHTRRILQYYWPYQCTDTGCWRIGDPFAGPPPDQVQQRIEYTPISGEEAPPAAPTAPQPQGR